MKIYTKILVLTIISWVVLSCQRTTKQNAPLIVKDFGLLEGENDSISIELHLEQFKNYDELISQTEKITCNDSLPKITLKNNGELKRIYLRNFCPEKFDCVLIKSRNKIVIHNDTINKSEQNSYPLDSLPQILKRDLENNGKNPNLSDNPEKLLLFISYDKDGIEKLPNTLNQITQAFEKITDRTDLKIVLDKKINFKLLPPPPEE